MGFSGPCRASPDGALTRSSTRANAASATRSPKAKLQFSPSGGGARETRQGSAFAILLHPCGRTGPARFTRPVAFVLSRMQVYRTSRSDILPYSDPVQSSRVATQLAGPNRTLGPPCIPGSVCRRVRPLLDLAVCIPNEQFTPNAALTFRSFGALRSLPCQSGAILRAASNCWTDFLQIVCFQRGCAGICWIEAIGK